MIAAWMLYCALCAVGLSLAATLAEHALLAGRGPVRHVWFGAVVLSLAIPAMALRYAPRYQPVAPAATARQNMESDPGAASELTVSSPSSLSSPLVSPAPTLQERIDWRGMLARADQPLAIAWVVLSSALGVYFFGGIAALVSMRRGWRRRVVLGVPVFVSEHIGPALVGAVSPAIVVPEWALAMEPDQLALMLRHEQEHRRARDGQLLTLAQFALIAMPWNAALWWQLLRLRVAVELDCDARVLRDADARSYGDLLLEVVRPRSGLHLMGATAFAERATQLERRIRVMARRRDRASRGAGLLAASIALAAVTTAWVAPRPPAPMNAAVQLPRRESDPSVVALSQDDSARPALPAQPAPHTEIPTKRKNSRPALSEVTVQSLLRYGTAGIINPMLMILRDADSLGLTAKQADSVATLNRWYRVRLDAIWSPVAKYYVALPEHYDPNVANDRYSRAPEASIDLLARIAPNITALLTAEQRDKLPAAIAAYLDPRNLAVIRAGTSDGVFAPGGGFGGGRGGRGRSGGGGDPGGGGSSGGRGRSGE